jgi:UDP-N-acetylenolpyruvoylglucosamine reductase
VVDDLDFEIRDVTFEAKVLNKYGTFDWIANSGIEDLGYAYLHSNFLDKVALTIITLRVNLSYIDMHEQHLQKGMFVRVNFFGI